PEIADFDAELALPTMALQLFPPVLVGLVLAAMFAATMSTADSLILSCSAALTHDLLPHKIEKRWMIRSATAIITFLALMLALMNNQSVFSLVILSWSTLASAFAPLLLVYAFRGKVTEKAAIGMFVAGVSTALVWRWLGLHEMVYEGMPGILAGLLFYAVWYTTRKTTIS
ncbi:MAG: sodium/proline symporter, partial [Gammaproteobacteria bacterium]